MSTDSTTSSTYLESLGLKINQEVILPDYTVGWITSVNDSQVTIKIANASKSEHIPNEIDYTKDEFRKQLLENNIRPRN